MYQVFFPKFISGQALVLIGYWLPLETTNQSQQTLAHQNDPRNHGAESQYRFLFTSSGLFLSVGPVKSVIFFRFKNYAYVSDYYKRLNTPKLKQFTGHFQVGVILPQLPECYKDLWSFFLFIVSSRSATIFSKNGSEIILHLPDFRRLIPRGHPKYRLENRAVEC